MKLFIGAVLFLTIIALAACVSEDGARKHAERENAVATKAGMIPGMMWKAMVYRTNGKQSMELGSFESRDECHQAIQAHMADNEEAEDEETAEGHPASACVVVKSGS